MRRFTITSQENTYAIDAESISLRDDGIVTFFNATELVGLVRSWDAIESDEIEVQDRTVVFDPATYTSKLVEIPDPPPGTAYMLDVDNMVHVDMETGEETPQMAALRAHAAALQGPNVDKPKPEPKVIIHSSEGDPGPPPQIEMTTPASEPDAPGVSNDPIPEPEPALDVVDAIPEDTPTQESTGDGDPPAWGGVDSEDKALTLKIGKLYGEHRNSAELSAFVDYAEAESIPVSVSKMSTEQKQTVVAWWAERGFA